MKKKRRRLRKPIRMVLKGIAYGITAAVVDVATISTFLYLTNDQVFWPAVGTSLLFNVGLEYLFFRKEIHT